MSQQIGARKVKRAVLWTGFALFLLLGAFMAIMFLMSWSMMRTKLLNVYTAALINVQPVSKAELATELQKLLWRRGESWNALDKSTQTARRNEALETLIDEHLIRERALSSSASSNGAKPAFQQFLKQFEGETWRDRITAQGLTEEALRKQIINETQQRNALETLLVTAMTKTSDDEARAWFAAHQSAMVIPERLHARHLFLCGNDKEKPDRTADIQSIYQQLSSSTGFQPESSQNTGRMPVPLSELIAKYSEDDNNRLHDGDLGWFSRDRVPADFAEQVFALPIGKVSPPFQTKLGWHLVLVVEKRPARLPTYEEAKDEIVAKLDDEKRQAALQTILKDLRRDAKITRNEHVISAVVPPTE
jgi:hypothetical protein